MSVDQETEFDPWYPPLPPLLERRVPGGSGEAAIYSPEYLRRKYGNPPGTDPGASWILYVPDA